MAVVALTVVGLLVTIALLVGLAVGAWRYRTKQSAKLFALLQAVAAVWAGLTAWGLTLSPGPVRLRIWGTTTALSLLIIVPWFAFILSYIGRTQWLTVRRLGVVSVPVVIGAGLYFVSPARNPLVSEVTQETIAAGTVVTASLSPFGTLLGLYIYIVFLVGLVFVMKAALEGPRLFVGQALAFVGGSLVTIVASVLVILGYPTEGYPLTQVALGGQAILWGYAVFGQQLLQFVPAVAKIGKKAVFDDLDDGILVVDSNGIVVRMNPKAHSYLNTPAPVGDSVTPLLGVMGVDGIDELPARFTRGPRTYQADASRVRNWRGEPVGHAVIISDVTPLVRREQRLSVLSRILRHNVRNEMNIVDGIGEQLQTYPDDESASFGATLRETATSLTRVSEKANEIDRLVGKPTAIEQVYLPGLVDEVVSPLRDAYPDATVDVSVTTETVGTDPDILSAVLEEVVTNALEHAGDAPAVRIEVVRTDRGIEVTVSDDGPGIPAGELAPITEREETPLQHATSIGIWFITWGVQSLEGQVDFATTSSGTRVTLSVPDQQASGPEQRSDVRR